MKMFKTWNGKIEEVEVIRETNNFVVLAVTGYQDKNIREAKHSSFHGYYNTWEDAQKNMLEEARQDVERTKDSLKFYQEVLKEIESMKKPDEAA